LHEFSGPLGLKCFWGGQNGRRGGAILTHNELVLPFVGSYVCANFGENRSRNTTVRVPTDGYTDTLTDANRFYNLSHAICYRYGAVVCFTMCGSTDDLDTCSMNCSFLRSTDSTSLKNIIRIRKRRIWTKVDNVPDTYFGM